MEIAWLLVSRGLVLCSEVEDDMKVMGRYFDEVYKRRGLKISEDKSKVMLLEEEKGSVYLCRWDAIGAHFKA